MRPGLEMGSFHIPGSLQSVYKQCLQQIVDNRVIERIWKRDHTIWRPEPTEITNRLGWLDLPSWTPPKLNELKATFSSIFSRGFTDLVLMGMGGSSLCPEVFRKTFGFRPGFLRLHVLDSTVPSWVLRIRKAIDPAKTLFLVASKSGGTIEVMSAFKYFWEEVANVSEDPGNHFIAVTDPGTGLAKLATEKRFLAIFENPSDIGGRFSALSLFGMVPAQLMGLATPTMLEYAGKISQACCDLKPENNPGAQLGAFLAACQSVGKDKLTLVFSASYDSLGLWVEQLVAESTGKEGKGILPIATEPVVEPEYYGNDRVFVAVREEGNGSLDHQIRSLIAAGYPVAVFTLQDPVELGGEFYRWEFATSVASHFLQINPFDQPNVQEAKTLTGQVIETFKTTGSLPALTFPNSFDDLMHAAVEGEYLAIMPYLVDDPGIDIALNLLRARVVRKYGIATTNGYGPRFLHSTGQYHKGGPANGLFLQLISNREPNLPVPGEVYGFDILAQAQAMGDAQALISKGKKVARIELGENPAIEIRRLIAQV